MQGQGGSEAVIKIPVCLFPSLCNSNLSPVPHFELNVFEKLPTARRHFLKKSKKGHRYIITIVNLYMPFI